MFKYIHSVGKLLYIKSSMTSLKKSVPTATYEYQYVAANFRSYLMANKYYVRLTNLQKTPQWFSFLQHIIKMHRAIDIYVQSNHSISCPP